MYMTTNLTTTEVGQATATVLARTRPHNSCEEIITWELLYPRYIHSEFMTHRMFSRNACSSRATPTKTLIEEVRKSPVFFDEVRFNQRGMTGGDLVDPETFTAFTSLWLDAAEKMADIAEEMAELRIAKQTINRLLEPFLPIRVICTTTMDGLENFYRLRLAKDAQPEIQSLAKAMQASQEKAFVTEDTVHMPYACYQDEPTLARAAVRCIAACARVSVARANGKEATFAEDLDLVNRLLKAGHMTPFEHIAFAHTSGGANFCGWQSIRYRIENELDCGEIDGLDDMLDRVAGV